MHYLQKNMGVLVFAVSFLSGRLEQLDDSWRTALSAAGAGAGAGGLLQLLDRAQARGDMLEKGLFLDPLAQADRFQAVQNLFFIHPDYPFLAARLRPQLFRNPRSPSFCNNAWPCSILLPVAFTGRLMW